MTRRRAVIAIGLVAAALTEKVDAQKTAGVFKMPEPMNLMFNLRAYKSYEFTLDGERLAFTPEEIFKALRS